MTTNPYAIYVNCDGSMDYDNKSSGGVGYVITFPESADLEEITNSRGKYIKANIERLELEAIIQGMKEIIRLFHVHPDKLKQIRQVIFVTDRFALQDSERTNPFLIKEWRKNKWISHDGKSIKNSDLLDELDKMRKKIIDTCYCRLNIEYQRRTKNKVADKLAKLGKKQPIIIDNIAIENVKTSKRIYDGSIIDHKLIKANQEYKIHIYRKEPVRNEWEVFAEIIEGEYVGRVVKIYVYDSMESKLHRHHKYLIRIKSTHKYHVRIFKTIVEVKDKQNAKE